MKLVIILSLVILAVSADEQEPEFPSKEWYAKHGHINPYGNPYSWRPAANLDIPRYQRSDEEEKKTNHSPKAFRRSLLSTGESSVKKEKVTPKPPLGFFYTNVYPFTDIEYTSGIFSSYGIYKRSADFNKEKPQDNNDDKPRPRSLEEETPEESSNDKLHPDTNDSEVPSASGISSIDGRSAVEANLEVANPEEANPEVAISEEAIDGRSAVEANPEVANPEEPNPEEANPEVEIDGRSAEQVNPEVDNKGHEIDASGRTDQVETEENAQPEEDAKPEMEPEENVDTEEYARVQRHAIRNRPHHRPYRPHFRPPYSPNIFWNPGYFNRPIYYSTPFGYGSTNRRFKRQDDEEAKSE